MMSSKSYQRTNKLKRNKKKYINVLHKLFFFVETFGCQKTLSEASKRSFRLVKSSYFSLTDQFPDKKKIFTITLHPLGQTKTENSQSGFSRH